MININNIYHMLSYAFKVLQQKAYQNVATESFEHATELYAAILIKGVAIEVKKGLSNEYIEQQENLSMVRGKINITDSIKQLAIINHKLNCSYDELSVNITLNQILKTTMRQLLKTDISSNRKQQIKKLLLYFNKVKTLNIREINWEVNVSKHHQSYKMLLAICRLIIDQMIQLEHSGHTQLMTFQDEQHMARLYERFILEYYKKHFPKLSVTASYIPWMAEGDEAQMLPRMKTDVMLRHQNRYLIIDAKYYDTMLQTYYDTQKIQSPHLYQIFTYVKNQSAKAPDATVAGMLLYAKTTDEEAQQHTFQISGNQISVDTLDLSRDFYSITQKLNDIAETYFDL